MQSRSHGLELLYRGLWRDSFGLALHRVTSFRSPGPGGCCGLEPGAVVVPPGAGLVAAPPSGPAQAEGEAGTDDEPGGALPGQAFDAGRPRR